MKIFHLYDPTWNPRNTSIRSQSQHPATIPHPSQLFPSINQFSNPKKIPNIKTVQNPQIQNPSNLHLSDQINLFPQTTPKPPSSQSKNPKSLKLLQKFNKSFQKVLKKPSTPSKSHP